MLVKHLRLRDFRNYVELTMAPGPGLNILVGANAQGKSNLLEALYALATTRSLRAGRESELVRRSAESASVWAEVARESGADATLDLSVFVTDRKAARVNGARRARVLDLLGELNAIFFGALDLSIVSGEPAVRRRYLNVEISQISPKYCFDYAAYRKALDQRNRLLRDLRDRACHASGLEAWDEQLVRRGAPVLERRRRYVDRLAPMAARVHSDLTDGAEALEVRYVANPPLAEERSVAGIEELLRGHVARVGPEEQRRGTTLVGPQRDDLLFLIDGLDARVYGSQGQQRTVVLSLRLAEYLLIEEDAGEPPIMLLDDVMSDLDDRRRGHLMEWMHRRCQTFVTCTNLRAFSPEVLAEAFAWQVEDGAVARIAAAADVGL